MATYQPIKTENHIHVIKILTTWQMISYNTLLSVNGNMLILNRPNWSFQMYSKSSTFFFFSSPFSIYLDPFNPPPVSPFIGWVGFAGEQGALRPYLSSVNTGPERRHHGDQRLDTLPAERNHDKDRRERDCSQHRRHQHARNVQAQWCMLAVSVRLRDTLVVVHTIMYIVNRWIDEIWVLLLGVARPFYP